MCLAGSYNWGHGKKVSQVHFGIITIVMRTESVALEKSAQKPGLRS